jgi:hypothetical protein
MLTADSTANNVDNELEITFTEDAAWRSKVTEVKVGATPLGAGQYSLTSGKLTINQGVIQTVGDHTITIIADGYDDSIVMQNVTVGAFSITNSSSVEWSVPPAPGVTSNATLTARDQYNNPIIGYQFKYNVNIDNGSAPNEVYTIDGQPYTSTAPYNGLVAIGVNVSSTTDSDGKVVVEVIFPSPIAVPDGGGPVWTDAAGNPLPLP